MAIIKKCTHKKRWRGCGEKGTLLHSWWECKLIQPVWKTVWRFLKKLGIKPPSVSQSVQLLTHVWLFATPWTAACQASLSITNSTQTHVYWVSDAIQPPHPLSSPSPPTFNLSQHQGLFKWVSSLHECPKYWSFSFNISPSNEYSGLISFMTDWLDLLTVQGTLKSLLQHHSSKASILRCSAFLTVQLSQQTGKFWKR